MRSKGQVKLTTSSEPCARWLVPSVGAVPTLALLVRGFLIFDN